MRHVLQYHEGTGGPWIDIPAFEMNQLDLDYDEENEQHAIAIANLFRMRFPDAHVRVLRLVDERDETSDVMVAYIGDCTAPLGVRLT